MTRAVAGHQRSARTHLLAVALVLFWSSGFIGAALGPGAAGAQTLLTWRCLVIALLLVPFLPRPSERWHTREWVRQAVLALLCQCLYLTGVFWAAAAGVPAGTSALVASLQPAVVLLATAGLHHGAVRRVHLWGLLAGTAGVALAAAGDVGAGASPLALALPVGAVLSLAAGTLLHQRWTREEPTGGRSMPLLQTLAVQSLFTAGFTTAVAAPGGDLLPPPSSAFWTAVGWTVVAGLGSYAAYYRAVDVMGADRANGLLYLTPAVTALWAAALFGGEVRSTTLAGLALSAAGAALLLRGESLQPVSGGTVTDRSPHR